MSSEGKTIDSSRRAVLVSAFVLLAAWCWVNVPRLSAGPAGGMSFGLGVLFGMILIFRPKIEDVPLRVPGTALAVVACLGVVLFAVGLLVPIHQFEWLGVLMLLYASLAWALPSRYGRDLLLALFIIYWVHPLPGQVFGPIQLEMQRLSVKMSEGLLQIFNIRVWGDGLVLRTGARVFGVPEECSGLKTAMTVFFCGIGVGLIMRLRWRLIAILLTMGMVQVLLLNVIRISGMVWLGKDRSSEWNDKVLHDSMGVFLLLAVGLIHLDAVLLRQRVWGLWRKRELEATGDMVGEPEDKMRRWPTFWRYVFCWWRVVAIWVILVIMVIGGAFRLRPDHRAEMLRGVCKGLMPHDLENAERAIQVALQLKPGDADLLYDRSLILVSKGKAEEALAILRRRPLMERPIEERVLEVRALLSLKRIDEVPGLIKTFPAETFELPGVALVLTEFNAILDRPSEVAKHAVKASRGVGTQERLRLLFPYMASRDLWETIRNSDSDLPYALPIHGVIAAEARLRISDINGAANVLRRAMKGREKDSWFLGPVIRVARERPGSEWVDRFEAVFKANLNLWHAADLTLAMEGGFAVGRPDIGWLAYRMMEVTAPDDPMLMIAPAEHGRRWFSFQHGVLGVSAMGAEPVIDVKPFYHFARHFPPWSDLWKRIPLADELGSVVTRQGYERRLKLCLESLEHLEGSGKLDLRLQLLYGQVLGELGRWNEAHSKLRGFETATPRRKKDFLLAHASLYKAQQDWEMVVESLGEYMRQDSFPPLTVWLDMAGAGMSLNMGPLAAGMLEEAREKFPESEEWCLAMAGVWNFYGFSEEALFLVNRMKTPPHPAIKARLLLETGRIVEGEKLSIVERLGDVGVPKRQTELLAPAEWAAEWRGGKMADADYAREAVAVGERKTPFLKKLAALKKRWYEVKGRQESSDMAAWEAAGRDRREKALALTELVVLLLRQGRNEEAVNPAEKALELAPEWSLTWRLNLILKKDPVLAEKAIRACPWDSELWLGYVVTEVKSGKKAEWADAEINRVITKKAYSPGALVRAGDFLVRQGLTNAACEAARSAIRDGQGLLPAYVLGIQCGIKTGNRAWAGQCARSGAEQALEPWPFYKIIVGLKAKRGGMDPDVVRALEGLAAQYPQERIWSERLGEMYFLQGQTDRAIGVLEDAIAREQGGRHASPRTYLMAAEAARREGNQNRAVRILQMAMGRYPNDPNVLNNLVYTLAQEAGTLAEAKALLPRLIEKGRDDFAVNDTAALVYLRAGDLKRAEEHMRKALTYVKSGDYAWLEVYLNAAEMQIRLGKFKEARESLGLVMKTAERSADVDARARDLQNELTRREREQQRWF
jgi:exosortase